LGASRIPLSTTHPATYMSLRQPIGSRTAAKREEILASNTRNPSSRWQTSSQRRRRRRDRCPGFKPRLLVYPKPAQPLPARGRSPVAMPCHMQCGLSARQEAPCRGGVTPHSDPPVALRNLHYRRSKMGRGETRIWASRTWAGCWTGLMRKGSSRETTDWNGWFAPLAPDSSIDGIRDLGELALNRLG
jgi:hypothetical protein